MSTSIKKSLTYGKNYSFDVKARGYYDYLETQTITKETEDPINITLKEYDGLKYNVSDNIIDFSNTILPYVNNNLERVKYGLVKTNEFVESDGIADETSYVNKYKNVVFTDAVYRGDKKQIIDDNGLVTISATMSTGNAAVIIPKAKKMKMKLCISFSSKPTSGYFGILSSTTLLSIDSYSEIGTFKPVKDTIYFVKIDINEKNISFSYSLNDEDYTVAYTNSDNNEIDLNYPLIIYGYLNLDLTKSSITIENEEYNLSEKSLQPNMYGVESNPVYGSYPPILYNGTIYASEDSRGYYSIPKTKLSKDENLFILFKIPDVETNTGYIFWTNNNIKIRTALSFNYEDFSSSIKCQYYTYYNNTWNDLMTVQSDVGYRIKIVFTDSHAYSIGWALADEHSYEYKYVTETQDVTGVVESQIGHENDSNDILKGEFDISHIPGTSTSIISGCIDSDLTYAIGTDATFNCFANKNTNILLTDKDSYEDYRYLGQVEIKYPDPAADLNVGNRIDNKATVVGNFTDGDGQEYVVAVLDGTYHGSALAWSNEAIDSVLPNYKTYDLAVAATESATFNMNQIETNYDITTYPAFNHCKTCTTVTFNKKEYTPLLPNAAEVEMINTNWSLVQGVTATKLTQCWSSTEKHTYAWRRTDKGWYNSLKTKAEYSAIPVIEIPIQK